MLALMFGDSARKTEDRLFTSFRCRLARPVLARQTFQYTQKFMALMRKGRQRRLEL